MANLPDPLSGPPPAPPTDQDLGALLNAELPRRSWAAWGGFWLGIVLIFLWLPTLLRRFMGIPGLLVGGFAGLGAGLLVVALGIVGIVRTRRRRRRGRGLAIASLPLGLCVGFLQLAIGVVVFGLTSVSSQGDKAIELLRSPSGEAVDRATRWHADVASMRFQAAVTPEVLAGWLTDTLAEHGQLQEVTVDMQKAFGSERGATLYRVTGQFVNGSAPIEVVIGFDSGMTPRVDDIRVNGSSPRKWEAEEEH